MKYCKNCGKDVVKDSDSKFTCKDCGNIFYINPKGATALVLIDKDNKLILGRRAQEPQKGKLDCIGGFVDVGENFEEGMIRELYEESGLQEVDIEKLEYLGSAYDPYKWQDRIVPVVSVYFISKKLTDKEIVASDDLSSFEHVDLKDIKRDDIAWDGMWEIIKKLESSFDF